MKIIPIMSVLLSLVSATLRRSARVLGPIGAIALATKSHKYDSYKQTVNHPYESDNRGSKKDMPSHLSESKNVSRVSDVHSD